MAPPPNTNGAGAAGVSVLAPNENDALALAGFSSVLDPKENGDFALDSGAGAAVEPPKVKAGFVVVSDNAVV